MNPPRRTGEDGRPFVPQGKRALAVFAIPFVLAAHPALAGWAQNLGQQPRSRSCGMAVEGPLKPPPLIPPF
jgi:hypothetical protein